MNVRNTPFEQSVEVARVLAQAVLGMPVTCSRYNGQVPNPGVYLVAWNERGNLKPFTEHIPHGQGARFSTILRIAKWIDGLTAHNHFLHAWYEDETLTVDIVIPHKHLWEAQIESMSRGGSRIHGETPKTA